LAINYLTVPEGTKTERMMFQDWRKKIKDNPQISTHLLWDVDSKEIDWEAMKKFVVQRVIERGGMDDFYALFRLYGGFDAVRNIIKEIPVILSPRDEAFVRTVFNLKKEDLQCYKQKQLREAYLNS
jgi:hypothetical protein